MRKRRPSQTASMVAMLRVLADEQVVRVDGFSDPVARGLVPRRWALFGRAVTGLLPLMPGSARRRALGVLRLVPLRVMKLDACIDAAVREGALQVVILGAGLDTRAWRLSSLSRATVFEVDHPATQAWKRDRVAPLRPLAADVRFVPVDFERERLGAALAAAGHDADRPTVFVWEGVVMYLGDAAFHGTLGDIANRSAAKSVLALQYNEPNQVAVNRAAGKMFLSVVGEPLVGARSRATVKAALEAAGLDVVEDTGADEWALSFGTARAEGTEARAERIVVATKR